MLQEYDQYAIYKYMGTSKILIKYISSNKCTYYKICHLLVTQLESTDPHD